MSEQPWPLRNPHHNSCSATLCSLPWNIVSWPQPSHQCPVVTVSEIASPGDENKDGINPVSGYVPASPPTLCDKYVPQQYPEILYLQQAVSIISGSIFEVPALSQLHALLLLASLDTSYFLGRVGTWPTLVVEVSLHPDLHTEKLMVRVTLWSSLHCSI